jgi:hypothetical protein
MATRRGVIEEVKILAGRSKGALILKQAGSHLHLGRNVITKPSGRAIFIGLFYGGICGMVSFLERVQW